MAASGAEGLFRLPMLRQLERLQSESSPYWANADRQVFKWRRTSERRDGVGSAPSGTPGKDCEEDYRTQACADAA
jgi:hypothetical protein